MSIVKSNLHTHSTYCDGKNNLEDMVKKAISLGYHTIGFSGHGYVEFCDFGMGLDKIDKYLNEIDELKVKYKNQIKILKGVEVDNVTIDYDLNLFDYILFDSHGFFKNGHYICVDGSKDLLIKAIKEDYFGNPYLLVEEYYDTYYNFVKDKQSLFLPHYDIIVKLNHNNDLFDEDSDKYKSLALKHLKALRKLNIPLEINTGAISRKYRNMPYPSPFILEAWLKLDGEVVLSSDCHDLNYLDCYFNESIKIIKDIGYQYLVEYDGLNKTYIKL